MFLIRKRLVEGIVLYAIPLTISWFIFRFISWIIEPQNSIKNAIFAFGVFVFLIIISFAGGAIIAKIGKQRKWWVRLFFAIIALFLLLPVFIVIAPISAFAIYLQSKLAKRFFSAKESRFGCTITSIAAAIASFAGLLFVREEGHIKETKTTRTAVIVMNHNGSGDYFTAALVALFRNWRVMVGANLWKYKIFHWFFSVVGIPIYRETDDYKKRLEAVNTAKNFLRSSQNGILIVFPEGTRNRCPEDGMLPFKKGAFEIACELGVPIVPIVLVGTNNWRKPSKQDTTSYKGVKRNYLKLFFSYFKQFFKTGINPTFVKIIYCKPIPTMDKTVEGVMAEVRFTMGLAYGKNK